MNTASFFLTRLVRIHYLVFKDQMSAMIEMADDDWIDTEVYPQMRPVKYTNNSVFVNLFLTSGKKKF